MNRVDSACTYSDRQVLHGGSELERAALDAAARHRHRHWQWHRNDKQLGVARQRGARRLRTRLRAHRLLRLRQRHMRRAQRHARPLARPQPHLRACACLCLCLLVLYAVWVYDDASKCRRRKCFGAFESCRAEPSRAEPPHAHAAGC